VACKVDALAAIPEAGAPDTRAACEADALAAIPEAGAPDTRAACEIGPWEAGEAWADEAWADDVDGDAPWTVDRPDIGVGGYSVGGMPLGPRRRPLDVWVDVGVFCAVVGVFCDAVGVFFCFAMLGDWVSIVSGVITDGG
jgi:hypothetical protein